jgi:cation diffusion facilitator CzcD-associated flavoprotein CzcO
VFQRTPSSIDVRNNAPIDPDWFATLEPGLQQEWLLNFTTLQTGGFADEDLVKDGWTDISKRIRDRLLSAPEPDLTPEGFMRAYHESDDEKMAEIRARVDELIDDPATAEALKPWYRQLCKRPCFHDEYLQAYNTRGTHLIDTDGKGVEEITETGVVVRGVHYELDCLIYASGFEVGTEFTRRSGYDMTGKGGVKLSDYWAGGMRSLHGIHVRGFPNVFVVGFAQGANLISNIPHNLTEAGITIASVIDQAEKIGADQVEVTEDAEQAWLAKLESGGRSFGGDQTCTPGYYNNEGQDAAAGAQLGSLGYPEGPVAYFDYIKAWRESGDFDGVEFH